MLLRNAIQKVRAVLSRAAHLIVRNQQLVGVEQAEAASPALHSQQSAPVAAFELGEVTGGAATAKVAVALVNAFGGGRLGGRIVVRV